MATARKPRKGQRPMRITNSRLARVRLDNPQSLPGIKARRRYTPRERQQIRDAAFALSRKRSAAKKAKANAPKPYDPLAPLTGDRLRQERESAERLEFGPKEQELRSAMGRQEQTAVNRAQYYEDYRQALREANARVNEANRQNVETQQARVDMAHTQDSASLAARNAQAAEAAQKLGRAPVDSSEGAQALESRRSAGNQSVGSLRERAASDTKYLELRAATAALKKAEDAGRNEGKAAELRREARELAGQKGAFRTDFERKTREGEREWAAIQKEFGLKEEDMRLRNKATAADRRIEQQKVNAQKIVARIYASADKTKARAQIRVAKLQLEKGKIDQKQYREIVNIYKGLPKKGQPGGAAPQGSEPRGEGSGPGGSLAPWERDRVDRAYRSILNRRPELNRRKSIMDQLVKAGIPARLARIAWSRYEKKYRSVPQSERRNAPGAPGQGSRPQ